VIRLSREELLAEFRRAWEATQSPADVAEAIQTAVLARLEMCDAEAAMSRIGPRSGRRVRDWSSKSDPRIDQIIAAVSAFRSVPVCEIKGHVRDAPTVQARHEAAYLLRVATGISYEVIGELLGGRGHQPILAGCRKIQARIAAEPAYGERLRALVAQGEAREMRRVA
jgi:hypothetical protein